MLVQEGLSTFELLDFFDDSLLYVVRTPVALGLLCLNLRWCCRVVLHVVKATVSIAVIEPLMRMNSSRLRTALDVCLTWMLIHYLPQWQKVKGRIVGASVMLVQESLSSFQSLYLLTGSQLYVMQPLR
ncbi:hypothetical protein cyc_08529 [Cyclospora cayetanensis]|uniref:Uncharacterized protein n=1 Tax=Cyclospora cayetanensis TaxID=88456 RepID=A0A1D3D900_9EIME|nr:hypothetical protein cyc_08529 [Cyclospora cayetanensis]